jgi:hypothetical protein
LFKDESGRWESRKLYRHLAHLGKMPMLNVLLDLSDVTAWITCLASTILAGRIDSLKITLLGGRCLI